MKTIWKFPISLSSTQSILAPAGAKILSAQVQNAVVCLWMEVNPENPKEQRNIEVFGTGHAMDEAERVHLGTVQTSDGMFVWHVFETL